MGTKFNASPQETDNATYLHSANISTEAQKNRKILSEALSEVGFVNYEPEWWHWSIGDRYWAFINREENAHYNVADEQWINQNITNPMNND